MRASPRSSSKPIFNVDARSARTEYDNISISDFPEIRKWLIKEGAAFHNKARGYLSQFDLDINPKPDHEGGARVTVGTFSYTEEKGDV